MSDNSLSPGQLGRTCRYNPGAKTAGGAIAKNSTVGNDVDRVKAIAFYRADQDGYQGEPVTVEQAFVEKLIVAFDASVID